MAIKIHTYVFMYAYYIGSSKEIKTVIYILEDVVNYNYIFFYYSYVELTLTNK